VTGGISLVETEIHEALVLGSHQGVTFIVTGTGGGHEVAVAARGLIDAFLDNDSDAFSNTRALIVSVETSSVRMAHLEKHEAEP
jgi:hypothetical protein